VKAVFSVDLFNEGVDVPNVDTVLDAASDREPVLFLQQLGRGLRRSRGKGKSYCTVLDFVGTSPQGVPLRSDAIEPCSAAPAATSSSSADAVSRSCRPAATCSSTEKSDGDRAPQPSEAGVPSRTGEREAGRASLSSARERPSRQPASSYLDESAIDLDDIYSQNRPQLVGAVARTQALRCSPCWAERG
jgi:superfamily II DNA or RNA helicase